MNWQPIASAPKDGTEILAWRADCGIVLVRWTCMDDFCTESEIEKVSEEDAMQRDWFFADFVSGGRLEGEEVPTHWMPLPPPPVEEAKG